MRTATATTKNRIRIRELLRSCGSFRRRSRRRSRHRHRLARKRIHRFRSPAIRIICIIRIFLGGTQESSDRDRQRYAHQDRNKDVGLRKPLLDDGRDGDDHADDKGEHEADDYHTHLTDRDRMLDVPCQSLAKKTFWYYPGDTVMFSNEKPNQEFFLDPNLLFLLNSSDTSNGSTLFALTVQVARKLVLGSSSGFLPSILSL